ncbi:MAG TPA: hypothetical protein VG709_06775 [Actinomycetota bacterium]|nr:hypothetical protein [Actinomycetota bacterium]
MPEDARSELADLFGQAEAEVRGRLKRQPRVHPQFRVGVQVAMRWMREAMAARLGADVLESRSEDDPRP